MGRAGRLSMKMDRFTLDCRSIGAALKAILEAFGRGKFTVTKAQYVFMVNLFALFSRLANKFFPVKDMLSNNIVLVTFSVSLRYCRSWVQACCQDNGKIKNDGSWK